MNLKLKFVTFVVCISLSFPSIANEQLRTEFKELGILKYCLDGGVLNMFSLKNKLSVIITFICIPFYLKADYLEPDDVNLVNQPHDTIQRTRWKGYPVLVHKRNDAQIR